MEGFLCGLFWGDPSGTFEISLPIVTFNPPEYWWAKRNTWGCGDMADQNLTPKTHSLITQDEVVG